MVRVLVTGGHGFIGRYVMQELAKHDAEAYSCGRHAELGQLRCDLRNPEDVWSLLQAFRPTHLLHLAWSIGADYTRDPANHACLHMSKHLIDAFYETGGERFVGVGTCFEYELNGMPCHEANSSTVPDTLYGQCKLHLGDYLRSVATSRMASYAWCRPFYVLGPEEPLHKVTTQLCTCIENGNPLVLHSPLRNVDYIDVRDLATALVKIIYHEFCGTINVGTGSSISIVDIARALKAVTTRSTHLIVPPGCALPPICAVIETLQHHIGFTPQLSVEKSIYDIYNSVRKKKCRK